MTDELDPDMLVPGMMLRHRAGGPVTLAYRKSDGSGWWNTDGSGLDDRALLSGDWFLVSLTDEERAKRWRNLKIDKGEVEQIIGDMQVGAPGLTDGQCRSALYALAVMGWWPRRLSGAS